MKAKSISLVALAFAAITGCAAEIEEPAEVSLASQELTLQECDDQRKACVSQYGFLGALTICPVQYTTCTATASNGVPAEVTRAAAEALACTENLDKCLATATTASGLAECVEAEAQCLADILDVELPTVVSGTAVCLEDSVECITSARRVSHLVECAESLTYCAAEQVASIIPEEVISVIGDVTECTAGLNACVRAATTPAQLTACGEEQVQCVAGSLNVDLPNVPLSDVIECTDAAATCALSATRITDVLECTDELRECAADVVETIEAPPVLDCAQVWTSCMVRNPLNFFGCASERRACERK